MNSCDQPTDAPNLLHRGPPARQSFDGPPCVLALASELRAPAGHVRHERRLLGLESADQAHAVGQQRYRPSRTCIAVKGVKGAIALSEPMV